MVLKKVFLSTLVMFLAVSDVAATYRMVRKTGKLFKEKPFISLAGLVFAVPSYILVLKKVISLKHKYLKTEMSK